VPAAVCHIAMLLSAGFACSRPGATSGGTTSLEGATQGSQVHDSAGAVALGCQLVSGVRERGVPSGCHLRRYIADSAAYVLWFRGDVRAAVVGPGSYSMAEVRIPKNGSTVTVTYFAE